MIYMIYVDIIPIHFRSVPGGQQNTSIAPHVSWSNNSASLCIAVINTPTLRLKELPKFSTDRQHGQSARRNAGTVTFPYKVPRRPI